MVAGHLTLKNGKYYAVLNYKNAGGQRKTKWISLGLSEKGNKRKAEAELARLRAEFEPPKEAGDLSSDGKWCWFSQGIGGRSALDYGTVRNYTFSNLTVNAFILGFNHNSAKEGANKIHFQIGKIGSTAVALCDSNYNSTGDGFRMNTSQTNSGGWNASHMRKTVLGNSNTPTSPLANSLMAALPADLRAVMQPVTKYTDNTANGGGNVQNYVTATTDYLFLLAEFEVFGTRSYANSYEQNYQAQYDYYKAGNSRVAYNHSAVSTAVWWWLRSPYYYYTYRFQYVNTDGHSGNRGASYCAGVRPGFAA